MRIVETKNEGSAVENINGVKRKISTVPSSEEFATGDWVMVHTGFAIERVDLRTGKE